MKKWANKLNLNRQGFTLIEVMMAMVILGIGLFSIAALQMTNMKYNTGSKKTTEGYNWAMGEVEFLLASNYAPTNATTNSCDSSSSSNFTCAAHSLSQGPYTVVWNVSDNSINVPNSVMVNVNVTWNNQQVATVNFTRTQTSF